MCNKSTLQEYITVSKHSILEHKPLGLSFMGTLSDFLAYETLFDALVVTKLPLITTYNHL